MNYTNGNKTEAAKLLNIALTTLCRKLEEYKLGLQNYLINKNRRLK